MSVSMVTTRTIQNLLSPLTNIPDRKHASRKFPPLPTRSVHFILRCRICILTGRGSLRTLAGQRYSSSPEGQQIPVYSEAQSIPSYPEGLPISSSPVIINRTSPSSSFSDDSSVSSVSTLPSYAFAQPVMILPTAPVTVPRTPYVYSNVMYIPYVPMWPATYP